MKNTFKPLKVLGKGHHFRAINSICTAKEFSKNLAMFVEKTGKIKG